MDVVDETAPPPPNDPNDVVSALQTALATVARTLADGLWELGQLASKAGEGEAPDPTAPGRVAASIRAALDALDGPGGLVHALPPFPVDLPALQERLAKLKEAQAAAEARLVAALQVGAAKADALRDAAVGAVAVVGGGGGGGPL